MSRKKGDEAEEKACEFLKSKNFEIIKQNFYAKKLGEIDIIAKKESVYHFIEVKSAKDYETAINNISPNKLSKLKRSMDYYIQSENIEESYCLDVIIISQNQVDFLENITI